MKVETTINNIRSTFPVSEKMECTVAVNAKAFEILSRMYSDPISACIRELSVNGVDSHIAVGKKHIPIEVTLPSMLNSQFRVRDFGESMTPEKVREVYRVFFGSDKTAS